MVSFHNHPENLLITIQIKLPNLMPKSTVKTWKKNGSPEGGQLAKCFKLHLVYNVLRKQSWKMSKCCSVGLMKRLTNKAEDDATKINLSLSFNNNSY